MRLPPPARLSILIYHRVLAEPDPLFPAEVDRNMFEGQLRALRRFFNVLPLSEAARRLRLGRLPPRSACITFDDGYADNEQIALPILQRYRLPACFFIATAYLNGGRMWNDSVIDALRHTAQAQLDLHGFGLGAFPMTSLPQRRDAIASILAALKYLPFEQREKIAQQICVFAQHVPRSQPMMRTGQVVALHRAGMEIGAHTARHPILATLPERAALDEIACGKRALEDMIGAPVRLFAYPNGKPGQDYGARHVDIVKTLGFEAAVSTHWGAARYGDDPFQLPRFTPWDRNRLRFLLRLGQNLLRPSPLTP